MFVWQSPGKTSPASLEVYDEHRKRLGGPTWESPRSVSSNLLVLLGPAGDADDNQQVWINHSHSDSMTSLDMIIFATLRCYNMCASSSSRF